MCCTRNIEDVGQVCRALEKRYPQYKVEIDDLILTHDELKAMEGEGPKQNVLYYGICSVGTGADDTLMRLQMYGGSLFDVLQGTQDIEFFEAVDFINNDNTMFRGYMLTLVAK